MLFVSKGRLYRFYWVRSTIDLGCINNTEHSRSFADVCRLSFLKPPNPSPRFPTDRSKAVPLFFFVCASKFSYVVCLFVYLFITCPSFGAPGGLYFVIVAFLNIFTYILTFPYIRNFILKQDLISV